MLDYNKTRLFNLMYFAICLILSIFYIRVRTPTPEPMKEENEESESKDIDSGSNHNFVYNISMYAGVFIAKYGF